MNTDRPPPRFIPPQEVQPRPARGDEPIVWFEMPGGLHVGLRPIHPDDRDALVEGFRALSEDSRYHRFLTPMSRLSDSQARYLTELDQVNHFAWGIGIRDPGGEIQGIGVARYVRDTSEEGTAEVAVAITDSYQGLGLGSLLVRALAVVATTHGIERLIGFMLGDNRPMVRIFQGIGAGFVNVGPGLVRAEAVLRTDTLCTLGDDACTELIRVADRAAHPSVHMRRDRADRTETPISPISLPSSPGDPMDDGNLTCRQCARSIDDLLTWCPFCGAELQPGGAAPQPSAEAAGETDDQMDVTSGDPFAPTKRGPVPTETGDAAPSPSGSAFPVARVVVIALAILVLVGAVAAWFFLIRDDNRGDLSVLSIGVGDCWNDPEGLQSDGELADVPEVPCDEPHANEVFAVIELPDGGSSLHPGQIEVELQSFRDCLERFESYVGVPYSESPLAIYTLYPTLLSWYDGDREVICSVYLPDGSALIGSERDSGDRLVSPPIDISGVHDCPGVADGVILLSQGFIDYFEILSPEELEASFETTPAELQPLYKSEALISERAHELRCSFEDLNILVMNRAGMLSYTTEFGGLIAEDIATYGFFTTW